MKKKVILVGVDGRPSIKGVYSQMQSGELYVRRITKKAGSFYRHYSNNSVETLVKEEVTTGFEDAIVIRWGNRIEVPTNKGTIVYNRSEAIAKATNKSESRTIFSENGVRCPKLVTPQTIKEEQYPVIARPFQHSKGKNFVILKDYATFLHHYDHNNASYYYSEFINKTDEFRVHCASGKILAIMSKPSPEDKSKIAWNRALIGEEFTSVKWNDWNVDVCKQALNAVHILGLDMGGVDVIVKDGLAYVLEVNTAPTLNSSPYVTTKYAKYFDWLLKSETRREHFEYGKYKEVKSYAWKDFNFQDRPANKGENE